MHETVTLTPVDGWGFSESIDGNLAQSFGVEVLNKGVQFAPSVIGWIAKAVDGKYIGSMVKITPRNKPFSGVVVLSVEDELSEQVLYSGFAHSKGLKPTWSEEAEKLS